MKLSISILTIVGLGFALAAPAAEDAQSTLVDTDVTSTLIDATENLEDSSRIRKEIGNPKTLCFQTQNREGKFYF